MQGRYGAAAAALCGNVDQDRPDLVRFDADGFT